MPGYRSESRGPSRSSRDSRSESSREKISPPGKKGASKRFVKDRSERPKIQKGPWSANAYLPSYALPSILPAKRTPRPVTKKAALKTETPASTKAVFGPGADGKERLQKLLARCGVASRRKAELLILEGAVTVNGRVVTELGTRVDAKADKIKVEGRLIYTEVEPIYMALYKPKGMISSLADPEGRRHVGHIIHSVRERVITIGRLNYNSEGLLLLTNDGNLAEKILKTRDLPKIYMVKVKGHPNEKELEMLKRGIFTAEGVVRFNSYGVEQSLKNKSWIKLEVAEGSQLDLREMLNQRGLLVDRIVRTAIGTISIHGLEPGEYRFLKRSDFERLLEETSK